jgi:parallel beta-helix repeat protein
MSKRAALLLVLVLAIALCLVSLFPVKAASRTITVPDDYPTISVAIGNASDGDTVFVRSGNYTESLTIDKSILLLGEESKTTIITAPLGGVFSGQTPIKIFADNVRIYNLTVNNYNALGFGISTIGNGTEIIGNTVYSQTAISTRAPFTAISENNLTGYITPVLVASSYCNITNNILSSNSYGVDLEGSSNFVSGNTIAGYPVGYGIFINGNSNNVSHNMITNKDDGISVLNGSHNTVTANSVDNCSEFGLRVDDGFNNTFSENGVSDCGYGAGAGLGAYNNTIYHNNFVNNVQQAFVQANVSNYWDNGVEGNFWSDYWARYPNATEVDSLGVFNAPYVIDANNTDNYPLVAPFGSSSPEPVPEAPSTFLVVAVSVTVIAVAVGVGILVNFKKRKR